MLRKKNVLLLIGFSLFTLIKLFSQVDETRFDILNVGDGLSHSVVTDITQDSKGFIWLGTQDGLNWYNGYEFKVFKNEDTSSSNISGNFIRCIYEDRDSNLWIGTENNGLNLFNRDLQSFSSIKNEYSNKVLSIFHDDDNALYVGTGDGIHILNKQSKRFSTPAFADEELQQSSVNCITRDTKGRLWLGTDKGVFRIDKNREQYKLFSYNKNDKYSLSNNNVHCIHQDSQGNIVVGTNQGMNLYNDNNESFTRYYYDYDGSKDLTKSEIYDIKEDRSGNIWFGTFGGGLIKWDMKKEKAFVYKTNPMQKGGLSNDHILSLFVDKSGLLWIGTYGGGINKLNLVRISFGKIQVDKTRDKTLLSNEVYAIYEDKFDNLWLGSEEGLSIYNKKKDLYYNLQYNKEDKKSLSHNTVYCITGVPGKGVWVGTNGGGINFISEENILDENFEFSQLNKENTNDQLLCNEILYLYEDNANNIWVGTYEGLNVYNHATSEWRSYTHDSDSEKSLADNTVQCIYQDNAGHIWIGTANGLSKFNQNNNNFFNYYYAEKDSNSLPNNSIYCITQDKNGLLWLGTDAGLCCMKGKEAHFKTFTIQNGLLDNVIYGILVDDENNLWVSTNKGLSKFAREEGLVNYSFINYNKSNWLHCDAFNIGAYHKNDQGVLYFGCRKGVTYFHPDEIRGNLYVPPVHITKFQLFFETVPVKTDGSSPLQKHITETDKMVLKHTQDVLYFEFAALNYIQSDKNNYAYKMEGFNDEWIYPQKNKRSATYTNLDPGSYTFRVRASNNNGIWNHDGAKLHIVIKPPFYQQVWFYVVCVIGFILLTFLYVHVRTKKLKYQRKILEDKVRERTEEVLTQKEELQTALDNLKKTQTQLVDKEKMASLGQLTAGVAHEINNPINFVSGNVSPLERDMKDMITILDEYDREVKSKNLEKDFEKVESLKKDLDYDFLKQEVKDLIKGIKEGAARTSEIVKSLRSFSRLDENDLKMANINKGIESTLLILRNKLKNRIEVEKNFGQIPEIMCFPGKLNQVFMNIISNAAQAIHGNGKITIKTRFEKGNILISIKDNGIGMDEKTKNRVFEPFFTTKDVGDGTGLGLSISYGIIENHNGSIKVKSEPGKGSEFIIQIPEKSVN